MDWIIVGMNYVVQGARVVRVIGVNLFDQPGRQLLLRRPRAALLDRGAFSASIAPCGLIPADDTSRQTDAGQRP
jgi:hypothetical protein